MKITTIGLDLAKRIFQVHGVDATGQVLVRKWLRRSQILPFFAKLPYCEFRSRLVRESHDCRRPRRRRNPSGRDWKRSHPGQLERPAD
jgi:transposase